MGSYSEEGKINVWGARVHNLKNIDVEIPRGSLTVITGLSGSGKSSLAFDTIYAEGQRRYIDTFSAYARNFHDLPWAQRPRYTTICVCSLPVPERHTAMLRAKRW